MVRTISAANPSAANRITSTTCPRAVGGAAHQGYPASNTWMYARIPDADATPVGARSFAHLYDQTMSKSMHDSTSQTNDSPQCVNLCRAVTTELKTTHQQPRLRASFRAGPAKGDLSVQSDCFLRTVPQTAGEIRKAESRTVHRCRHTRTSVHCLLAA